MTRAEWLEIAVKSHEEGVGLCLLAQDVVGHRDDITTLGDAMGLPKYPHPWPWVGSKWYKGELNNLRCLFACLMAAMTDRERRELVEGEDGEA